MRAIYLAALILLAVSENAAGSELMIFGVGNQSCGAWVEAHKGAPNLTSTVQQNWVFGYMAAFSSITLSLGAPDASHVTDADGMTQWMTNYCGAHPLDTIYKATDALSAQLVGRATKH